MRPKYAKRGLHMRQDTYKRDLSMLFRCPGMIDMFENRLMYAKRHQQKRPTNKTDTRTLAVEYHIKRDPYITKRDP